jgi:hypothetical protein
MIPKKILILKQNPIFCPKIGQKVASMPVYHSGPVTCSLFTVSRNTVL